MASTRVHQSTSNINRQRHQHVLSLYTRQHTHHGFTAATLALAHASRRRGGCSLFHDSTHRASIISTARRRSKGCSAAAHQASHSANSASTSARRHQRNVVRRPRRRGHNMNSIDCISTAAASGAIARHGEIVIRRKREGQRYGDTPSTLKMYLLRMVTRGGIKALSARAWHRLAHQHRAAKLARRWRGHHAPSSRSSHARTRPLAR